MDTNQTLFIITIAIGIAAFIVYLIKTIYEAN